VASNDARFDLGALVGTPGALRAIEAVGQSTEHYISRHVTGDWGDVDFAEAAMNEVAIREGLRILSLYELANSNVLWILTVADRSSTYLFLPEEY
jgi:hypothetical protein